MGCDNKKTGYAFGSVPDQQVMQFDLFAIIKKQARIPQFVEQNIYTLTRSGYYISDIAVGQIIVQNDYISHAASIGMGPVFNKTDQPAFGITEHEVGLPVFLICCLPYWHISVPAPDCPLEIF